MNRRETARVHHSVGDTSLETAEILIIGSGAAGLSCAVRLAEAGHACTVVCKTQLASGSSLWAQGGISAVLGPDDTQEAHVQDTLIAGAGLCDEAAVRYTVEHGAEVVHWLLDRGVAFTHDENDPSGTRLHLTREGGHSHRRVAHAADATGRAVETTLADLAIANPLIHVCEHTMAVDLIVDKAAQRVLGAYLLDVKTGTIRTVTARAIVLATGGANQAYLYLSNPDGGSSGDGIAMAWRAGCRVSNMEFMQFHPTGLYHPGSGSFLISEALRGEGAKLTLPDGSRFMDRFDPRAELAPRDIVARAIDHEMKRLGIRHVWLDIRHRGPEFIHAHFPSIQAHCLELGIDITQQPIPVVPIAHFTCGGVTTDLDARTDLAGLYAIGEVACTGLHGANRMASNSLLECLVFARAATNDLLAHWDALPTTRTLPEWDASRVSDSDEDVVISHNWLELRTFMWDYVGIVRTTKRLLRAQHRVHLLQREIAEFYRNHHVTADLLELRNLVTVADLIVRSALGRHESRGLHYTLDYLQTDAVATPTVLTP
ncbi:MAG: L-aspartate oxidase [Nevskiaceae bacterium]|nr:MAG: L-aspartate oxidase [Nevskiaceae bacterium]TBR73989.1 MAG: L-aspartate oxidase [Nevskiaceae bacterium]